MTVDLRRPQLFALGLLILLLAGGLFGYYCTRPAPPVAVDPTPTVTVAIVATATSVAASPTLVVALATLTATPSPTATSTATPTRKPASTSTPTIVVPTVYPTQEPCPPKFETCHEIQE